MPERVVEWAIRNRVVVILLFPVLVGVGLWAGARTAVDAFPDTTPVQVQVNTTAPALNAEEIEQQITLPVELSIGGLPGLLSVRSVSKFGLSQVVATFSDSTSMSDARQHVSERIAGVELPSEIGRPTLGPISSGLGEVLHYIVSSADPDRTLEELRTFHDWVIKPELRKVPGVAEVNSWGGHERQFHVVVSPKALVEHGLVLDDLVEALERNNRNVGGGLLTAAGQSRLVHGSGRAHDVEEIADIVVATFDGVPILVRDLAEDVRIDHGVRHGAVTAMGRGEAVLGLAFMLLGENGQEVTRRLQERLRELAPSIPPDIRVEIVYDRTELTEQVIETVTHNLAAGAILVVLVLFVLLGDLRAGLLVALVIPAAMLFAILGMYHFSIAATLLSLGAIDFGILVDGSVVMTESNLRHLATRSSELGRALEPKERLESLVESSRQVARPVVYGMAIITVVFIPVLTLTGVEGKMFRPMAWTFIFALVGALGLALTLSPALGYYVLPRKSRAGEGRLARALSAVYARTLDRLLRLRWLVLTLVTAILAVATWSATRLGGEFVPRLAEGAIVLNTIRLAGISLDQSNELNTRIERELLEGFPDEIRHVWSRVGTAEVATDPMGLELTDVFVTLHPRSGWKRARTQAELARQIETELADLPGMNMVLTQPIEMRMNEMESGIRSDIGVKVYGDDFDELVRISDEVQRVLLDIAGQADVAVDQLTGQPTLSVVVDRRALSRYGVAASTVLDFVEALGTTPVGEVFDGQRRFPLVIRLPDRYRQSPEALSELVIPTPSGQRLPLRAFASVTETEGVATINREWGRRLVRVQCNVVGRDVSSFVDEARRRVAEEVALPPGYVIDWGGQFEHLARARLRLSILIPTTLLIVFFLLCFSLRDVRDALLIYSGIPFAAVGGIAALHLRGIPFSVSAAVGFIALGGIAVLNGQILVTAIRRRRGEESNLAAAVRSAASQRLRPVLATAITDAAGFLPMALSMGIGAEVQRPLATVVVGGVLTSTVLTLLVLPLLYTVVHRARPGGARHDEPATLGESESP